MILPEEIVKQIQQDANSYCKIEAHSISREDCSYCITDYTEGATSWAEWKVRYDELKDALLDILKETAVPVPSLKHIQNISTNALASFSEGEKKEEQQ